MRHILLLVSVATLLISTGCIFPGPRGGGEERERGERRGHEEFRDRGESQERSEFRSYGSPEIEGRASFGYPTPP